MKITTVTVAMMASLALAAPAANYEQKPTPVLPSYPTQSVGHAHYKRAVPVADELAEPSKTKKSLVSTKAKAHSRKQRAVPVEDDSESTKTEPKKPMVSTKAKAHARKQRAVAVEEDSSDATATKPKEPLTSTKPKAHKRGKAHPAKRLEILYA